MKVITACGLVSIVLVLPALERSHCCIYRLLCVLVLTLQD